MARVSASHNDSHPLFICSTQTVAVQVTVERGWAVVNRVPEIVATVSYVMAPTRGKERSNHPSTSMFSTFYLLLLLAILWRLSEEKVINVVVLLQRALCPLDDSWGALPQVIAHHRLLVIFSVKVLVVATLRVPAA